MSVVKLSKIFTNQPFSNKATETNTQLQRSRETLQNLEFKASGVQVKTSSVAVLSMVLKLYALTSISRNCALLQAWLDLEKTASETPIAQSGAYPVTRPALSKAIQGLDTFTTMAESRGKQLDEMLKEAEEISAGELMPSLRQCREQLEQVLQRYDEKRVSTIDKNI